MIVGIPREVVSGERRVALIPELVPKLVAAGLTVAVQPGAGVAAGFLDRAYADQGARLDPEAWASGDILLKVRPPSLEEVVRITRGATLISFLQPYDNGEGLRALAASGATAFSMELMPRISRAQSMDALSAMSTVSGYLAVLLAASRLPKFFPLLMTAAGMMAPARVFVIGAGVAGLEAIGTARRLGAIVEAYDMRPAVKEQVESVGARFAELDLGVTDAEDGGGYAKGQSESVYRRQQELMARYVAAADVVISTALVPGQRAPVLINEEMVKAMRPGSIVVDLAAEQGGNCSLTEPGLEVVKHGVLVMGPLNLPSVLALHASEMYARTATSFLDHLLKDGRVQLDLEDELTRAPLVTHGGQIVHEAVKARLA